MRSNGTCAKTGELASSTGTFQFGQDFYQPNAELALIKEGPELYLRWPGDSRSPLLPVGKDQFVDRAYWEQVRVERDTNGHPTGLAYGSFHGRAVPDNPIEPAGGGQRPPRNLA